MCLGGELLSKVCRLYCKSYRASCSGLPDLFLWDTHKKLSKVCWYVDNMYVRNLVMVRLVREKHKLDTISLFIPLSMCCVIICMYYMTGLN